MSMHDSPNMLYTNILSISLATQISVLPQYIILLIHSSNKESILYTAITTFAVLFGIIITCVLIMINILDKPINLYLLCSLIGVALMSNAIALITNLIIPSIAREGIKDIHHPVKTMSLPYFITTLLLLFINLVSFISFGKKADSQKESIKADTTKRDEQAIEQAGDSTASKDLTQNDKLDDSRENDEKASRNSRENVINDQQPIKKSKERAEFSPKNRTEEWDKNYDHCSPSKESNLSAEANNRKSCEKTKKSNSKEDVDPNKEVYDKCSPNEDDNKPNLAIKLKGYDNVRLEDKRGRKSDNSRPNERSVEDHCDSPRTYDRWRPNGRPKKNKQHAIYDRCVPNSKENEKIEKHGTEKLSNEIV